MALQVMFGVLLSLSIFLMTNAQVDVSVSSTCKSYPRETNDFSNFTNRCYIQYTHGTHGGSANYKCGYWNISPLLTLGLIRLGQSVFTRILIGQTNNIVTRYGWRQPNLNDAVVETLFPVPASTDVIVESNGDGYVLIRCVIDALNPANTCNLPVAVYICTYTRNPTSDVTTALVNLAGSTGLDIYNIVPVNQTCSN